MTSFSSNLSVPDVKREPEMVVMPTGGSPTSGAPVPNIQMKSERLNGFPDDQGVPSGVPLAAPSADATWPPATSGQEQQCCLIDNGRRCTRIAGNASYNKRIQKTVAQKKLKLQMDTSVRNA